jgi:hypothetical protein
MTPNVGPSHASVMADVTELHLYHTLSLRFVIPLEALSRIQVLEWAHLRS